MSAPESTGFVEPEQMRRKQNRNRQPRKSFSECGGRVWWACWSPERPPRSSATSPKARKKALSLWSVSPACKRGLSAGPRCPLSCASSPRQPGRAPAGPLLLSLPRCPQEAPSHPAVTARLAVWLECGLEECGRVVTKVRGTHQGHTLGGPQALFLGHLPRGLPVWATEQGTLSILRGTEASPWVKGEAGAWSDGPEMGPECREGQAGREGAAQDP